MIAVGSIEREGDARERSERAAASRTGLVHYKNNADTAGQASHSRRKVTQRLQINPQQRRCRRMAKTVDHAMRLSETRLARSGGFRFRRVFVTLTYRQIDGWEACHVREYLDACRKWAKRKRIALPYVWVGELQKRGAVHYHLAFWLPTSVRMPAPDKSGWWSHGSSNVRTIKGGCTGVMAYMSKYLSKTTPVDAMNWPAGARMHGNGGLLQDEKRELRYRHAAFWVRDALGTFADIRKAQGGWVDRVTGLFFASPWRVEVDGSGLVWAFRVDDA